MQPYNIGRVSLQQASDSAEFAKHGCIRLQAAFDPGLNSHPMFEPLQDRLTSILVTKSANIEFSAEKAFKQ